MCRDPKDANLVALENGAQSVVGNDWRARLDKVFIENLGKYRKYDGKSVQDLMRALRNKVGCFFFFFFWVDVNLTPFFFSFRNIIIRIYRIT